MSQILALAVLRLTCPKKPEDPEALEKHSVRILCGRLSMQNKKISSASIK